jgi:hypothetical protein
MLVSLFSRSSLHVVIAVDFLPPPSMPSLRLATYCRGLTKGCPRNCATPTSSVQSCPRAACPGCPLGLSRGVLTARLGALLTFCILSWPVLLSSIPPLHLSAAPAGAISDCIVGESPQAHRAPLLARREDGRRRERLRPATEALQKATKAELPHDTEELRRQFPSVGISTSPPSAFPPLAHASASRDIKPELCALRESATCSPSSRCSPLFSPHPHPPASGHRLPVRRSPPPSQPTRSVASTR